MARRGLRKLIVLSLVLSTRLRKFLKRKFLKRKFLKRKFLKG